MLESLFSAAGMLAMAGWAALILLPGQPLARGFAMVVAPLLIASAYAALIGVYFAGAEGGFGSLADVATLFQTPGLLLAGWLHYLAFDLFIGGWQVETARREGIRHLFVIPCLLLTFLLGPIGLLLFQAIRAGRRLQVVSAPAAGAAS